MKRFLFVLLFASLAGNIALVAARVMRGRSSTFAVERGSADGASPAGANVRDSARSSGARANAAADPRSKIWRSVESGDYSKLASNLRAAGVPDDMVRTIVGAMLSSRYQSRRLALMAPTELPPFWKADRNGGYDPAKQSELRALGREQQQVMKDLFGSGGGDGQSKFYQHNRYGPLPDDKIDLIEAINSDYSDMTFQTMAAFRGQIMPWDREQIAFMGAEQRKDIAAILTPAELETYELYNSGTANSLRSRLSAFDASEEEFRALFKLQSAFDAKYATSAGGIFMSNPQDAMIQQRRTDQDALNQGIKAALGDQRYADFQRSQDSGFRAASNVVARLNLPAENAAAVYAMQKEYQQKASSIRSTPGQTADERNAAVAALAAEANGRLASLLTAQGAEAYKQSGGFWLRNLERPPPQPPRPP